MTAKTTEKLREALVAAQKRAAAIEAKLAEASQENERKLAAFVGPYVARAVISDNDFARLIIKKIDEILISDGVKKQRDRDVKLRLLKSYLPVKNKKVQGQNLDETEQAPVGVPEKKNNEVSEKSDPEQQQEPEQNFLSLDNVINWDEAAHFVIIKVGSEVPIKGSVLKTPSGKRVEVTKSELEKDGGFMGRGGSEQVKIWFKDI